MEKNGKNSRGFIANKPPSLSIGYSLSTVRQFQFSITESLFWLVSSFLEITLENISPEEVIVVGDSPYDAIAAGKVPLRTIGVLGGGFERETLGKVGCVAIYQDPADLLTN